MWRPLCTIQPERASIRSSALAAASAARGGVRNRRSAQAPASSGNSSREAAKRTFVLILGKRRAVGMASSSIRKAALRWNSESSASERALAGFPVAEQAPVVVHHERDAEHLEGDLLGVGVRGELALPRPPGARRASAYRSRCAGRRRACRAPGRACRRTRWRRRSSGSRRAARPTRSSRASSRTWRAGAAGRAAWPSPAGTRPRRTAAWPCASTASSSSSREPKWANRPDFDMPVGVGEGADGQAVEPRLADDAQRGVEDRGARALALRSSSLPSRGSSSGKIVRPFVFVKTWAR